MQAHRLGRPGSLPAPARQRSFDTAFEGGRHPARITIGAGMLQHPVDQWIVVALQQHQLGFERRAAGCLEQPADEAAQCRVVELAEHHQVRHAA